MGSFLSKPIIGRYYYDPEEYMRQTFKIEVKTQLSPDAVRDAVEAVRRNCRALLAELVMLNMSEEPPAGRPPFRPSLSIEISDMHTGKQTFNVFDDPDSITNTKDEV